MPISGHFCIDEFDSSRYNEGMRKGAILEGLGWGIKRVWIWALVAECNILLRLQHLLPVGRLRFIIAGRAFLIGMAVVELDRERQKKRF